MTKNTLVMPFIQALGYDVFNPAEVVPEFSAPIAILTDGNRYHFYSDLEAPNRMDTKPYMEFTLDDMEGALIPELRKLAKGRFDRDACVGSANELKYNREFKQVMARQMEEPDEDFVRFFIGKVYDGKITRNVRGGFTPVLKTALEQFLDDRINERLKNAMTPSQPEPQTDAGDAAQEEAKSPGSRIETTPEELEAFYLVKSLLMGTVEPGRVAIRDGVNFCNILLDDTIRQPLFRLHFNKRPWKVGLFDSDTKDERVEIEKRDDLLLLADRIRAAAKKYDAAQKAKDGE